MATMDEILEVRKLTDEVLPNSTYTDDALGAYIDTWTVNGAAARVWSEKAATYAKLVDISESGSSRKMGDLYTNAIAMANFYRAGGADIPPIGGSDSVTQVHAIRRRTSPTQ